MLPLGLAARQASAPIITFCEPDVISLPEPSPIDVFPVPVVVACWEPFPTAVFSAPAPVCTANALYLQPC